MKRICRYLLLLTILLSGTQVIQLPFISLSLFQVSFIIFSCCFIIYMLHEKSIKKGTYIFFSFLFFVSSILAYFTSINKSWATSYLLLGLLSSISFFAIPNLFDSSDYSHLKKTLIRSQYITFPFSIYCIYMFYFHGGLPNIIDLPLGMTIELENEFLLRSQASHQIRLSLPYATPPVLSLVMAICIIILLFSGDIFKKTQRYILIASFSIVLILTGSRTGIIGLLLTGLIYFIKQLKMKRISRKFINVLFTVFIIGIVLFVILDKSIYIQKFVARFLNISFLSDRHFLVPLDGLIIWTSSLRYFFLGIGFGSSALMVGAHTYLPPYFLNSIVTLLVERGILGLLIVIYLFSLLIRKSRDCKYGDYNSSFIYYALLCSIISAFTYEVLNCYFVLFIISIALIDYEVKR